MQIISPANNTLFFIHADKLLSLFDRQKQFLLVKQRDRRPGRAIVYYAGQVFGILDQVEHEYRITLYIGNPYDDIGFEREARVSRTSPY